MLNALAATAIVVLLSRSELQLSLIGIGRALFVLFFVVTTLLAALKAGWPASYELVDAAFNHIRLLDIRILTSIAFTAFGLINAVQIAIRMPLPEFSLRLRFSRPRNIGSNPSMSALESAIHAMMGPVLIALGVAVATLEYVANGILHVVLVTVRFLFNVGRYFSEYARDTIFRGILWRNLACVTTLYVIAYFTAIFCERLWGSAWPLITVRENDGPNWWLQLLLFINAAFFFVLIALLVAAFRLTWLFLAGAEEFSRRRFDEQTRLSINRTVFISTTIYFVCWLISTILLLLNLAFAFHPTRFVTPGLFTLTGVAVVGWGMIFGFTRKFQDNPA